MLVCFVPGPFALCTPGQSCSGAFFGCVTGLAPSLVKSAARSIGLEVNASCVANFVPACDAIATTQTMAYASGLVSTTTYAVETSAIMFEPQDTLKPWEFLSPFSWVLWAAICALALAITPCVTALVEYDPNHFPVAKNVATFLPDSVHAYAGVDTLKRTGDAFTADSALLSAVVAIMSRVFVALYQCNLVAYVIFSYVQHATPSHFETVATIPEFSRANVDASAIRVFDTPLAAFDSYAAGDSDAIVGSETFLKSRATCGDTVVAIDGPRIFDVLAYSSKKVARTFEPAFRQAADGSSFRVVSNVACGPEAKSITLNETLGVFVAFGACMALISAMAVIVHATRHENFCAKRRNPESPESLPESVHA